MIPKEPVYRVDMQTLTECMLDAGFGYKAKLAYHIGITPELLSSYWACPERMPQWLIGEIAQALKLTISDLALIFFHKPN